jgi:hypothetical protein
VEWVETTHFSFRIREMEAETYQALILTPTSSVGAISIELEERWLLILGIGGCICH